jgi:hypothetical protein
VTDATLYMALAGLAAFALLMTAAAVRTRAAWVPGVLIILLTLAAGLGASTMPGQPKAVSSEVARPKVAEVLWNAASKREGRIYVLLAWEGRPDPGYYWLPWDGKLEKAMSKARVEATARNRPMMVRNPFDRGLRPAGEEGSGSSGSGDGDGKGGHGRGAGPSTGDNAQADEAFYAAPPPPLPEKDQQHVDEAPDAPDQSL